MHSSMDTMLSILKLLICSTILRKATNPTANIEAATQIPKFSKIQNILRRSLPKITAVLQMAINISLVIEVSSAKAFYSLLHHLQSPLVSDLNKHYVLLGVNCKLIKSELKK